MMLGYPRCLAEEDIVFAVGACDVFERRRERMDELAGYKIFAGRLIAF